MAKKKKKQSHETPLAPHKCTKKRTYFTIIAMVNITWYTIVVLILSFYDHVVPSELTVAWFAAWTTELALLFGIKVKDNASAEVEDETIVNPITAEDESNACG